MAVCHRLMVGFEQRLELVDPAGRLREKGLSFWAEFVARMGAKILSSIDNDRLTAYLLSESSLFVWNERALLITCGQMSVLSSLDIKPLGLGKGGPVSRIEITRWSADVRHFFEVRRPCSVVRSFLGVDHFFPGFQVGDHAFYPFGYSLNAIHGELYFTVHISPEIDGGFCSFETNAEVLPSFESLKAFLRERFKPEPRSFASP